MQTVSEYEIGEAGSKTLRKVTVIEEDLSSVELSVNAKGIVQPQVKVYDKDPKVAAEKASAIIDELIAKYQKATV